MPKARKKRTRPNARADVDKGNTGVENGNWTTDIYMKEKMLAEMALAG